MKLTLLLPFVLTGIAAAQAPARAPATPMQQPEDYDALRRYLNLSDTQVRQMREAAEKARQEAGEKMKTLGPQIREKRNALQALLAKGSNDAAAVGKAMLEVESL